MQVTEELESLRIAKKSKTASDPDADAPPIDSPGALAAFVATCERGGLEDARRLVTQISLRDLRASNCLATACFTRHYKIAELIITTFGLTAKALRDDEYRVFIELCSIDDPRAASWLTERLDFTACGACGAYVLGLACERGHLGMAQWLTQQFSLQPTDARADGNYALRRACHRNRLNTARWLADTFALTAEDARALDNHALRWAAIHGHRDVVRWLTSRFGLTAEDARASHNQALRYTCMYGQLGDVQFVTDHFRLTSEDARTRNNEALRLGSTEGHLEVVQWLVGRFGLTAKDVLASGAVQHAARHNHDGIAQWLTRVGPGPAGPASPP
jgi:hypothetical protein